MESDRANAPQPGVSAESVVSRALTWLVSWSASKLQRVGLCIAAIASAWFITFPAGQPQRIPEMIVACTLAATLIWIGRPPYGVATQVLATVLVGFAAYILSQVALRSAWRADPFGPLFGVLLLPVGAWLFLARPSLTVARLLALPAIIAAVFLIWYEMTYTSHRGLMFESNAMSLLGLAFLALGVWLWRLRSGPLARRTSPY